MTAQACTTCRTTRREVRWSTMLRRHTCLACYLPHAPKGKRTPYRTPKPPPPTAQAIASQSIRRLMERVAPVLVQGYDIVGTCPLCRHTLLAHVGRHAFALECDGGCPEKYVLPELKA